MLGWRRAAMAVGKASGFHGPTGWSTYGTRCTHTMVNWGVERETDRQAQHRSSTNEERKNDILING